MKIKLTAEDFDRKVQRLLFVKQELETLTKEQDELINLLEGHYTKEASKEEIIQGVNFKMVKVPVNQGRNSYDADKLLPFIKAIRGAYNKVFKKIVIRKMDINVKALDKLIEEGKLPEEVLNKCRKDKWTFRSIFKKIETESAMVLPTNKKVM